MPNTVIAVSLRDDGATFDITVPVPELVLALPPSLSKNADLPAEPQRSALASYFNSRFSVRSRSGTPQPHVTSAK